MPTRKRASNPAMISRRTVVRNSAPRARVLVLLSARIMKEGVRYA
jgi:hypothetical protein